MKKTRYKKSSVYHSRETVREDDQHRGQGRDGRVVGGAQTTRNVDAPARKLCASTRQQIGSSPEAEAATDAARADFSAVRAAVGRVWHDGSSSDAGTIVFTAFETC